MSLKAKKLDQGKTELFISEFELRNVLGMEFPK